MQREESPAMATGLERIAAKARREPKLRFTSLAHHITKERVWENLCQIRTSSAPGVDGTDASVYSPQGISSAEHSASVYPETRKARETPTGRALCRGPGAPEKRCSGTLGYLRAGFSALLVWGTAWAGCPSSTGNTA